MDFSKRCPPVTLLSINTRYDPFFHANIGELLSVLRKEKILLIGTGGAVHDFYTNFWPQIIFYRNYFAQEESQEQWALDFRVCALHTDRGKSNATIREWFLRLMHNPRFGEVHSTDDHYMSSCFF